MSCDHRELMQNKIVIRKFWVDHLQNKKFFSTEEKIRDLPIVCRWWNLSFMSKKKKILSVDVCLVVLIGTLSDLSFSWISHIAGVLPKTVLLDTYRWTSININIHLEIFNVRLKRMCHWLGYWLDGLHATWVCSFFTCGLLYPCLFTIQDHFLGLKFICGIVTSWCIILEYQIFRPSSALEILVLG